MHRQNVKESNIGKQNNTNANLINKYFKICILQRGKNKVKQINVNNSEYGRTVVP